uniref:Glutamine-dependent NAD(+) synthetase n=1 Tax=candidate division WOR-3 bacterium TaxID=2052148 RepID=A0A7C4XLX3_UNCW3
MKIAIAQLNPVVGDVEGNLNRIIQTVKEMDKKADLIIFPELFLCGYPPQDLLERRWFIKKIERAIEEVVRISAHYPDIGIIFGTPYPTYKNSGRGLYNSAIFIHFGLINHIQHKSLLPTYDVFDEARYFDPASEVNTIKFKGENIGISICEDAWNIPELWQRQVYDNDPIEILVQKGSTLLVNISASPFTVGKDEIRFKILRNHTRKYGIPFLFVNQVGANDELIFDGQSMFIDKNGMPVEVLPPFEECVKIIDTEIEGRLENYKFREHIESVYRALILGVRDYLYKCGFKRVVIGLSGGIDSSVVACIAVESIGKENVLGVTMPGPFSSKGSIEDSKRLAENLGIEFRIIPITSLYESYLKTLKETFIGQKIDITEENIQARIRGNILMAISNKFGSLVLTTGNKSELAVGYCTLYGDMSGGLAVISDVPKTMVYKLAEFINRNKEIIPKAIIKKPPSAELKPNQLDQDTLPPYEILDPILQYYIEDGLSGEEIVARGFGPEIVDWVIKAVNRSEYKRRQAPPGLKVTSKAFGLGRRMPIAAKF